MYRYVALALIILAAPVSAKMDYDSIDAAPEEKTTKMDYDAIDGAPEEKR